MVLSPPSSPMGMEPSTKPSIKVVKTDTALKLAEGWVKNMSGSAASEPSELEFEGRPSRLGLGARITPKMKSAPTTDHVERKLLQKLNANKRQLAKNLESTVADGEGETSDDEEPESRSKAFAKKRTNPLTTPSQSIKRRK